MTEYLLVLRFALLNLFGAAALTAAYTLGYVDLIAAADGTRMVYLIAGVFIIGQVNAGRLVWRTSRELNSEHARVGSMPQHLFALHLLTTEHERERQLSAEIAPVRNTANLLVVLGLIGTVLGFIIALGGVDPRTVSDITAIGPMVSTLIRGMSTALYTTLVGAVLNVWLMLNYNLLSGGCVKLLNAIGRS